MDKKIDLFENLICFKNEYEWLDFKENWFSKDKIGEYISAIANGAALWGKEFGYIVWGINDKTKRITGTTIDFAAYREAILSALISPVLTALQIE